jgi:hypothetical protein
MQPLPWCVELPEPAPSPLLRFLEAAHQVHPDCPCESCEGKAAARCAIDIRFLSVFVMTNSILSIFAQGQTGLPRTVQRPLQALLQGQAAAVMPASRPVNRPASGLPLASHAGASSSPPGQRREGGCRMQPPAAPSWEELLGRR